MKCVLKACYEPFKYRNKGDHRTLLIDFDTEKLFGNPTYDILNPLRREFNSKDKTLAKQYIEERFQYLTDHKFGERLQYLSNHFDSMEAESLDRDHQRACKHGAKKCQKKPNIAFGQKLAALRAEKQVLLKIIASKKLKKYFDMQIAYTMMETENFLIPSTVQECNIALRKVQKNIKELEKDLDSLRS